MLITSSCQSLKCSPYSNRKESKSLSSFNSLFFKLFKVIFLMMLLSFLLLYLSIMFDFICALVSLGISCRHVWNLILCNASIKFSTSSTPILGSSEYFWILFLAFLNFATILFGSVFLKHLLFLKKSLCPTQWAIISICK